MERPWESKLIVAETHRGAKSSVATPRGAAVAFRSTAAALASDWPTKDAVEVCRFKMPYKTVALKTHPMEVVHIIAAS